jgi:uncharacterized membrane protein YphA (DoxX/SURF4 family)
MDHHWASSAALFVLRLTLGGTLVVSGMASLGFLGMGPGFWPSVESLESSGAAPWLAKSLVLAGPLSGLGLLLGFMGRLCAFVGGLSVAGLALFGGSLGDVFASGNLSLLGIAGALCLTGSGSFSLDGRIAKRMDRFIEKRKSG